MKLIFLLSFLIASSAYADHCFVIDHDSIKTLAKNELSEKILALSHQLNQVIRQGNLDSADCITDNIAVYSLELEMRYRQEIAEIDKAVGPNLNKKVTCDYDSNTCLICNANYDNCQKSQMR